MSDEAIEIEVRRLLAVEHFDERARERLRALGDEALEVLKRLATGPVRGEHRPLKSRAIIALADWDELDVIDTLADVLDDRDVDSRIRASRTLGTIGGPAAEQCLATYAETAPTDIELASVARVLARSGGPIATRALRDIRARTESPSVLAEIDPGVDPGVDTVSRDDGASRR
jgi:HEAT repeat protein